MDRQRWERIQALFHEAAELPAGEQGPFLEGRCADDPSLLPEVLAMLEEDARDDSVLDQNLTQLAERALGEGRIETLPREIGPYRLRSILGEGGMGVVYLAERTDLKSLVAIKLLRDAWLSPSRRARFASEQRTLAQLNHPCIARLYDADALPEGTPWFAMEYVDGLPLTQFCASHEYSIRQRIELFRAVCEAVLHAHQQAVIHRDLKPSNILVTRGGQPKLLDFGIAKQLEDLNPRADWTRTNLRLMTPAYAAPEQFRGEGGLGVHTDVYSLGVILYELLTGRPPFDLSDRTPTEALRVVAEDAPEKPSVAARRAAMRSDGKRSLRGEGGAEWADLDVLCLKAMQKEPARRYPSAESLIRDIDHYLKGEPLEARPDTIGYRVGKFVRRHWRAVSAVSATLVLVVGLVTYYTVRLASARNTAVAEASRTRRIQEFMNGLFEGGDPEAGPAESLRVVALLDRGVREAGALTAEVQAELYQTLGGIYQKLGNFERADSMLRTALDRRRTHLGPAHADVARSLVALGLLRADQSQLDEAERLVREGLAMTRRREKSDPAAVARATTALGLVLENRGSYDQAIEVLTEAVRLDSLARLPTGDVVASLTELANSHFYAGHYAVSDSLNRRVLEMDRSIYGPRHPHVAGDLINLGAIRQEQGEWADAERFYRQALEIYRAWYGEDHFETAAAANMVGRTLVQQGRLAEAKELLRKALDARERIYGKVHPSVASTLNELARLAQSEGRLDEAEADFRRMMNIYRTVYHDKHHLIGLALSNLGSLYVDKKDYRGAEQLFREALGRYAETLPADHLYVGITSLKLGRALLRQARYADAERMSLAGYQIVMKQEEPAPAFASAARKDLIEEYEAMGRADQATHYREEAKAAEKAESSR
jgi:serine/threonine protein kinase/tetratricopeptide (TPR) repeat protein